MKMLYLPLRSDEVVFVRTDLVALLEKYQSFGQNKYSNILALILINYINL